MSEDNTAKWFAEFRSWAKGCNRLDPRSRTYGPCGFRAELVGFAPLRGWRRALVPIASVTASARRTSGWETLEVLLADPDATRELWVYAAQRAILEVGFANELYTGGPEITELRARAERLLANPRFGGDFAERFRTSMLESDCDRLHDIAFEKLAAVRKLRSEARTVRIALRHSATAATLVALDRLFALLDEVEVKARDDLAAVDATWARLRPNGPEVINVDALDEEEPPASLAETAETVRDAERR
ncbi:hypothetical protein BN946_scf184758.g3 [Trametes cinnabarina]|uniref:Uncharacterized protein n=1 Tax=Pycnoporus cinnabarinus TaxID=5643 RepID=A0A060S6K0_PYCCI|nr:hypothetical protein BN946_scf184758.g3 [Trametes cinnabarina]